MHLNALIRHFLRPFIRSFIRSIVSIYLASEKRKKKGSKSNGTIAWAILSIAYAQLNTPPMLVPKKNECVWELGSLRVQQKAIQWFALVAAVKYKDFTFSGSLDHRACVCVWCVL